MNNRITLTPTSEAEWLTWRNEDLTSTEVAALFGASPYQTEFELYHYKKGTLKRPDFIDNDRITWGRRLESAIAYGVAEDHGLLIEPFKDYVRMPELRIGSSFDFKIIGITDDWVGQDSAARDMFTKHGPALLEIKNVDGLQFKRAWIDGAEEIEAPPHIELQAQHQLMVTGLAWTMIAPLVGGNTPRTSIREADVELHKIMFDKIAAFWVRYDTNDAPAPDYTKDAKAIGKLYVENDGSAIDLSDDPRVFLLCKKYKEGKAIAKAGEETATAAKAELLTIIGPAKTIAATGYSISANTTKVVLKAYNRAAGERVTISISQIPEAFIQSETPPRRDIRIKEAA